MARNHNIYLIIVSRDRTYESMPFFINKDAQILFMLLLGREDEKKKMMFNSDVHFTAAQANTTPYPTP